MRRSQGVFQLGLDATDAREQACLIADGRVVVILRDPDGTERPLPEVLGAAVQSVAEGLAEGQAVMISGADNLVSPAAAAQMLGVSRPMVGRWIAEGLLADVPVGTHHRIPMTSVIALRNERADAGYRAMAVVERAEMDPEAAARVAAAKARARKRIAER